MCSSEVQDCCWWSSAISGFKGQVLDSQSQAPCNPMLWRRGCQEHNEWQGWSCIECLRLLPFRSLRPTACPVLPLNTHQCQSPVSARLSKCVQTDVYHVICSAHFIKWVTKGNRPISIVKDGDLRELLTAGRPNMKIPSPDTISRNIKASFDKCQEHVARLLQVCQFNFLCLYFVADLHFRQPKFCTY
jgi:hypothetical protein